MLKTARIFITLFIAVLLLPACTRKQAPTPSDRIGSGSGMGSNSSFDDDIIPTGDFGSFDIAALDPNELEERGVNSGMSNGVFDGKIMVEGLLPSVFFGFNSSSISSAERTKLQQAADYLQDNPSHALLLEGHCDWYGTADYNIALGERRANSAVDYISTLGISPARLNSLSKGSLEAVTGLSKADSSQDRRADLIILK